MVTATRRNPTPESRGTPAIWLYPKQAELHEARTWVRGFVGGRGCGKTRLGAYEIIYHAKPGDSWMVVSPSYVVLHETTWPTFRSAAQEIGRWQKGVMSPIPTAYIKCRGGGRAEVVFRSGEDPESLRGPSKSGLWLDEASVMKQEVFTVSIACLRDRGGMGPVYMTFTPKGRRHWTFSTFYEQANEDDPDVEQIGGQWYRRKADTTLVRAGSWENPFLPGQFVERIRGHYSTALQAQELAGEFVDLAGLLFDRSWFVTVDAVPRIGTRIRYWDLAATHLDGCYTCGTLVCRAADGRFYVEDVRRGQWSPDERNRIIRETAAEDAIKYDNEPIQYVEQEPGSGGKEQALQMIRMLAGHPVYKDLPTGRKKTRIVDGQTLPGEAKIVRAQPVAAQAEAGNVLLVRGKWNADWLDEIVAFPESRYADQVDSLSGAFNRLCERFVPDPGEVKSVAPAAGPGASRFGIALQRSAQRW